MFCNQLIVIAVYLKSIIGINLKFNLLKYDNVSNENFVAIINDDFSFKMMFFLLKLTIFYPQFTIVSEKIAIPDQKIIILELDFRISKTIAINC